MGRISKISPLVVLATLLCACRPGVRKNLVPSAAGTTPGYWCTWGSQNFAVDTALTRSALSLEGGHSLLADNLTETRVFRNPGWASYFPGASRDLFLLFDAGWDVPRGVPFDEARWKLGSMLVAEDKFQSCRGKPVERLRTLNSLAKAAGWKGAGLWLAAHAYGDGENGRFMPRRDLEAYFRERARWCRDAGIGYWKVDYGFRGGDLEFRRMLTAVAAEEAPGLVVEHSRGGGPVNDEECPWDTKHFFRTGTYRAWDSGTALRTAVDVLRIGGVFRTYDVTAHFSVPTTLDRVASLLAACSGDTAVRTILNCEDEPYIGAVLGCAIGVMRHPLWIKPRGWDYDPWNVAERIDEVTRAVRWQRIAPAFGAGGAATVLDTVLLRDTWKFRPGDTWAKWLNGRSVMQAAPARIGRGCGLPEAFCETDPPYVVVSKHPNGATAVATFPRLDAVRGMSYPLADVRVALDGPASPIGVFGRYRRLVFVLPTHSLPHRIKVLAQDLAGDRAKDITSQIGVEPDRIAKRLVIPGALVRKIGLSARSKGDHSEPGLVIQIMDADGS
jgi:hypothetical protein